jgi:integrase
VRHYGEKVGITTDVHGFCVHALRATAATNALAHNADIAKVQEWLGHASLPSHRVDGAHLESTTDKRGQEALPGPGLCRRASL